MAPTTISLGVSQHWVGLEHSADGWRYGSQTYQIVCLPPEQSHEHLVSQTKIIQPGVTPDGADLIFNLRLTPYVEPQTLNIQHTGTDEITIRHEPAAGDDDLAEQRLKRINLLRKQGLISEDEYREKRNEILGGL